MSLGTVTGPGLLLVLAVVAVGVLHTAVPDAASRSRPARRSPER